MPFQLWAFLSTFFPLADYHSLSFSLSLSLSLKSDAAPVAWLQLDKTADCSDSNQFVCCCCCCCCCCCSYFCFCCSFILNKLRRVVFFLSRANWLYNFFWKFSNSLTSPLSFSLSLQIVWMSSFLSFSFFFQVRKAVIIILQLPHHWVV